MTGKKSSSFSKQERRRKCWWAVIFLIVASVIAFADSATINRSKREFVLPDWVEIASESSLHVNDKSYLPKAVKIREAKITYDGAQLWRIRLANEQTVPVSDVVSEFQETGLFSLWTGNDTTVDLMVRHEAIQRAARVLKEKNVRYDIIIDDLQKAIDEENPPLSLEIMEDLEGRKGNNEAIALNSRSGLLLYIIFEHVVSNHGIISKVLLGHRMEWSSYHRVDDIYGYLDFLAETYPDVCSVMTIGHSAEGRPLKVIRISNGKHGAPALWIDGGIHAREWISPAAVTYIIEHLVENSESLETDYYILPVVNPDGYEYTFTNDRLWRKNRRLYVGSYCNGVDLNRNFGYRWGGKGTSKDPCSDIFAGSAAFSEPESNAIKNFFEASAADFKAYLTFHSYGQYFLYPWGYDRRVPPDYADLERVGQEAATAMRKADPTASSRYTVGNSATVLYAAAGGSDDWAKAMLKIKYAYTIELRDTGKHGFILPAQYIVPTAKEALAAVQVITEACKSTKLID